MFKWLIILFCTLFVPVSVRAESHENEMELCAESAIVMEASTGTALYEKEADKQLPPASVTKIMTMLLIFDALEEEKIQLDTEVTTSENAASMGGSQVFLEPGEIQTVDTMLKCIAVASANDACVAMAELIAGSEDAFVESMNKRANELKMKNTHFENCSGLDVEGHLTTARDIAIMSRELITKYPEIQNYTKIWMENITHKTRKGTSEFGLSNTNKLIRHYEHATGLKTGSTSKAKFCLSATGEKDGIEMIAVVMAEPDSKTRVKEAVQLLNYGFGKCDIYKDKTPLEKKAKSIVKFGKDKEVEGVAKSEFCYVDVTGSDLVKVEKRITMKELEAPVKKGKIIGKVVYVLNDKTIGSVDIIAKNNVEKMTYLSALSRLLEKYFS